MDYFLQDCSDSPGFHSKREVEGYSTYTMFPCPVFFSETSYGCLLGSLGFSKEYLTWRCGSGSGPLNEFLLVVVNPISQYFDTNFYG